MRGRQPLDFYLVALSRGLKCTVISVVSTPFCFLSVHGSFIWCLHLPPSLRSLVQWTHPEKNRSLTRLPKSASLLRVGENRSTRQERERATRAHTAAWIFKEPPMPRVLGVLASVLIANANILAAAAAPSGGRLEALTVGQTPEPRLLILYI